MKFACVYAVILSVLSAVQEVRLVCVDVPSNSEAIVGRAMKLTCIYCMKREEISAETKVEWTYISPDKEQMLVRSPLSFFFIHVVFNKLIYIWHIIISPIQIYLYDRQPLEPKDVEEQWKGRLTWNGSKDLQDLSISIKNVTLNDTGRYECKVSRFFEFDSFKHSATKTTTIDLEVKKEGKWAYTPLDISHTGITVLSSNNWSDYLISTVWFGWLHCKPFSNML